MNNRTMTALAALKVDLSKEPGWVLAEQQEKRQPLCVWTNPELYKGKPGTAPLPCKPEELQPPKHGPKASVQPKAHPMPRSVLQASSKVVEKGGIEPLLFNTRETCRLLGGVGPKTLSRLEQRGLLRSVPMLRHKMYTLADIKSCVEGLCKWKA